jgi:glutamate dehydrogenase (NADP+)
MPPAAPVPPLDLTLHPTPPTSPPPAPAPQICEAAAKGLLARGVRLILEGANMPTTAEGVHVFEAGGAVLAPGKAANAGGVAVSGLEMAQNATLSVWPREEVDSRLRGIMKAIHRQATDACTEYGVGLVAGSNIAGFERVAKAMIDQGCV